ncbi:MAG: hypothetical protein JSS76_09860 [Bacteroidetes bacterium]|nr:hypothetical protein [Bacteroidota bacterium]
MQRHKVFLLLVMMVVYVPVGTLLHESGHILIARLLGYHTALHYSSMDWYDAAMRPVANSRDSFLITLGGNLVLDTISTGALLVLLIWRGRIARWFYWSLVFLSMLIYRHIVLTLIGLVMMAQGHSPVSFGRDESEIATYLHLPGLVLGWSLCAVSLLALYFLFFKAIDGKTRRRFLIALCIGCPAGYMIWMQWLGPKWLP